MQRVRFGIVGCGNIGKRHAAVIDAEPKAQLSAVCDIEVDRAYEIRELYGSGIRVYSKLEDLLEDPDVDVVNICTPHYLHCLMAVQAAQAQKHVLVEKPMALSVAEAQQMIQVAEASGVMLMVVKQNRFNIPVQMVSQLLEQERLGRIFMVQCNVLWNRNEWYYAHSPWRGRKQFEGGALFTQVSHFIDLLIWWFGAVVDGHAVIDRKNHNNIEIEDCGSAILEFASGVLGTLIWTTCVYSKNYEGSITIVGEKGTVKIGGRYLNKIEYWDVDGLPLPEGVEFVDKPNVYDKYQGSSSNHDKVIRNVIAKIHGEEHTVVDGYEAKQTIEVIELIYSKARYQSL